MCQEEWLFALIMSAAITILTWICWNYWNGVGRVATEPGQSPLYALLNEINAAAAGGAPFLAVSMVVALPDICVSLLSDNGRSTRDDYKQWCADNLPKDQFGFVTPDDLWSMRCGVLHNGRFGDLQHNVARVIFALPGNFTMTNCQANDAYIYSVVEFCQNFTRAVYSWSEANRQDPNMVANLPRLMQYREGGLPPYMVGPTVLA